MTTPPLHVVVFGHGYSSYATELDVLHELGIERITHVETDDAEAATELHRADAILVREAKLPAATIETLDRCRVIVRYGVGTDNIDLAAATQRNIYVANVPDYGSHDVATHALALLLAVAQRIVNQDRSLREATAPEHLRPVYRLQGKILGIVGFGRIGQAFWRLTRGLGFAETLVYDPYRTEPWPEGVEPSDLDRLCQHADAISLHLPLTDATRHLFDRERIASLKETAILVNTARGGLIDESALTEALRHGGLHGAGLDVFEDESPTGIGSLRELPNVVLTGHVAWYSEESQRDLQAKAAREVARVLSGSRPVHWVNPWTP